MLNLSRRRQEFNPVTLCACIRFWKNDSEREKLKGEFNVHSIDYYLLSVVKLALCHIYNKYIMYKAQD